jgi:hypothetical protein
LPVSYAKRGGMTAIHDPVLVECPSEQEADLLAARSARCRAALFALALLIVLFPLPARAASIFRLTAEKLAFYNNLYIIIGSGKVQIDLRNGSKISGNSFFMDLRLNRFVVAGGVRVSTPSAVS